MAGIEDFVPDIMEIKGLTNVGLDIWGMVFKLIRWIKSLNGKKKKIQKEKETEKEIEA